MDKKPDVKPKPERAITGRTTVKGPYASLAKNCNQPSAVQQRETMPAENLQMKP